MKLDALSLQNAPPSSDVACNLRDSSPYMSARSFSLPHLDSNVVVEGLNLLIR